MHNTGGGGAFKRGGGGGSGGKCGRGRGGGRFKRGGGGGEEGEGTVINYLFWFYTVVIVSKTVQSGVSYAIHVEGS